MSDYRGQAERLREWGVLDIQNQPALTVGMLRSAGAAIERLADEVDRLNHENFWLTRNAQPQQEKKSSQLPPVNRGDIVWGLGTRGGYRYPQQGKISIMEVIDGEVIISVRNVCIGRFGESVFLTEEEAVKAAEVING